MKKRIVSLLLSLSVILALCGCSSGNSSSDFSVTFIDVGQGDAALVECDGEYMLIDAGTKASGKAVVKTLKDRSEPITHLDILVASHLHDDHIGGMVEVLEYLNLHENGNKIDLVLSNSSRGKTNSATEFVSRLERMGNTLTVPDQGETYKLGSAEVKVIYNSDATDNDSLVLLITYQKTTFLFTGDIEKEAQSRVAETLREISDDLDGKQNLMKMPHHGAYNSDPFLPDNASDNSLGTLVSAAYANYFVISVGKNNSYNHPDQKTLDVISQALRANELKESNRLFRTDDHGDIVVSVASNGRDIVVTPSK